ncbi:hypothetical protein BJY01DRAFT_255740 [Aspergillus pseudoustus]|uniref:Uncharacterized protein n=1 Tax=Aspergillus pseudoustus TaxID=1810923 RepID=A0ABR4IHS6_9EURO
MTSFISSRPKLAGALCLITVGGTVLYLGKRRLNQLCPRLSVTDLPRSSACRKLVEEGESVNHTAWGMNKSTTLSSWSDAHNQTHWVTSFAALQTEIPISSLASYEKVITKNQTDPEKSDTLYLAQNLLAAFLNGRATGLEPRFLDKDVPPLSFTPGSHLFGQSTSMGAFLLGSWSSLKAISVQPDALPSTPLMPVSAFPSNSDTIDNQADAAGTVMYWMFPRGVVNSLDKAASYGLPWRAMDGGFQEYIVEKVSDETARVTYVMVECGNLYPSESSSKSARDYKKIPWLFYELHVLYAQILWYKMLRQLGVWS